MNCGGGGTAGDDPGGWRAGGHRHRPLTHTDSLLPTPPPTPPQPHSRPHQVLRMSISGETCSALGTSSPPGRNTKLTRSPLEERAEHVEWRRAGPGWATLKVLQRQQYHCLPPTPLHPPGGVGDLSDAPLQRGAAVGSIAAVTIINRDWVLRIARCRRVGQQAYAAYSRWRRGACRCSAKASVCPAPFHPAVPAATERTAGAGEAPRLCCCEIIAGRSLPPAGGAVQVHHCHAHIVAAAGTEEDGRVDGSGRGGGRTAAQPHHISAIRSKRLEHLLLLNIGRPEFVLCRLFPGVEDSALVEHSAAI